MAELIRIVSRDERDAQDLSDALSRRGIVGGPVRVDGHWKVDVSLKHEETAQLLRDVTAALETWLDDHHLATIPLRVGSHGYVLESHSGLSDDPSAAPRRGKRKLESRR